jgi:hypothetical protein
MQNNLNEDTDSAEPDWDPEARQFKTLQDTDKAMSSGSVWVRRCDVRQMHSQTLEGGGNATKSHKLWTIEPFCNIDNTMQSRTQLSQMPDREKYMYIIYSILQLQASNPGFESGIAQVDGGLSPLGG